MTEQKCIKCTCPLCRKENAELIDCDADTQSWIGALEFALIGILRKLPNMRDELSAKVREGLSLPDGATDDVRKLMPEERVMGNLERILRRAAS